MHHKKLILHPFRFAVILLALALCAGNAILVRHYTIPSIICLSISIGMAMACYWKPVPMAGCLLVFAGICEYAVPGYGEHSSFFIIIGIAIIAFEGTRFWALTTPVASCLYFIVEHLLRPDHFGLQALWSFCIGTLGITAGAQFLKIYRSRNKAFIAATKAQNKLELMQNNQRLAVHLHDALSQDLAAISMLAQIQQEEHVPDCEAWHTTQDLATRALTNLRTLMRQLHEGGQLSDATTCDIYATITAAMESANRYMRQQGFHGDSQCRAVEDLAPCLQESDQLVRMALREVTTNMVKHGDSSVAYTIDIVVDNANACIKYSNGIRTQELTRQLPGGNGIVAMHTVIESIGGKASHCVEDGIWHGTICIPLYHLEDDDTRHALPALPQEEHLAS